MRVVQTQQGDTVDMVCLRYFGFTGGITEQVMSLNTHLTKHELVLPALIDITLPDTPERQETEITQLWT